MPAIGPQRGPNTLNQTLLPQQHPPSTPLLPYRQQPPKKPIKLI
ncbi:hypothetical protein PSN_2444 [Pseudomonas sp. NGC7]